MASVNQDSDLSIAAQNYNADSDLSIPISSNENKFSLKDTLLNIGNSFLKDIKQPLSTKLPPGINMGSGFLSLAFPKGAERDLVANIPQAARGTIPTTSETMQQGIGRYIPFGAAGGASLLGTAAAGGAYGYNEYQPGQKGLIDQSLGMKTNKLTSVIEDSLINAITHGILPFGKNKPENVPVQKPSMNINFKPNEVAPFKQQASFPSVESEFSKAPIELPKFLKEQPPIPLSENISKELHENITGGKDFEQAGKDLADYIRPAYKNEVSKHSKIYNDEILDVPTDEINIHTGEPVKVRDRDMYGSHYLENYKNHEFPDENIQLLHNEHSENPTINNAHELQKEFGSEIGYLKKQNGKGNLDQIGKNKLRTYVKAQDSLKSSIRSALKEIDPKLAEKYDDVTQSWKVNVTSFEADKDLKDIARGNIKNPMTSQVISIFKNPEENINSVISKLPEEAKDKIIHIGMGKDIYQNAPKDLLAAEKSIRTKGLSSYVAPQHEQMFRNLRNNVEMEKNSQAEFERNQKMAESLQKAQQEAQEKSVGYNKRSEQSQETARSKSNKMAEEKIRELERQHNEKTKQLQQQEMDLIKEKQEAKKRRIAAIKYAVGGSLGYATLHSMGLSPEQLIAFYLGKNLNKNPKK